MSIWEFLVTHNFQPDYWQFYVILFVGFIWLRKKFRELGK